MIEPISNNTSVTNFIKQGFSKGYDSLVEKTANGMGSIVSSDIIKSRAEKIGASDHSSNIISNIASFTLTLFLLLDIIRSKSIADENKPYLLINTALVTIVAAITSMLIDNATDEPVKDLKKAYMAENFKFTDDEIAKILNQMAEYRRSGQIYDDPVHAFCNRDLGLKPEITADVLNQAKIRKADRENIIKKELADFYKNSSKSSFEKKTRIIYNDFIDYLDTNKVNESFLDENKAKEIFNKIKEKEISSDYHTKANVTKEVFESADKFRHQMKSLDDFSRGVSKVKSNSIFSLVVRFGIPLLSVPVTTWILDAFKNKDKNEKLDIKA